MGAMPPPVFTESIGKLEQTFIWRDGQPAEIDSLWGLRPAQPGGRPWSHVRAEGREFPSSARCMVPADYFTETTGSGSSKKRHRVGLLTQDVVFGIAGIWRPAGRDWPDAHALLTVPASPDVAPLNDRQPAVLREDQWQPWLCGELPVQELLEPWPPGSFRVISPRKGASRDLFDW
jgi:putative SOS response-associated peptidase YedK